MKFRPPVSQFTLWDIGLDDWTDEMRTRAIEIMDAWIASHGGRA